MATARSAAAATGGRPDGGPRRLGFGATARRYAPLWPLVLGLAVGRAGVITSSYGSYLRTDEGVFTDGPTLFALALLGILLVAIAVSKRRLSKRAVNRIMRACVGAQVIALLCLSALDLVHENPASLRFCLSVVSSIAAAGVIYYWLRRARGAGMKTAAVLVFTALALSELEIYLCALLPIIVGNSAAAALSLLQLPCMYWARSQQRPDGIPSSFQPNDFFGYAKTMLSNKLFLVATAIGFGFLSLVIGLLRGYPSGEPIAFSFATRTAYGLLTVTLCIALVTLVLSDRKHVMTAGMFALMQALACLALVFYAALPASLDVGAVFTTTLNALMNAFIWYIIIAFMSFGWRDPYYYAIGGRLVFLGGRACSRILLVFFAPLIESSVLMNALVSALLLISTQVAFLQFLRIARIEQDELQTKKDRHAPERDRKGMLIKLMGLDENDSLSGMRQASMRHNAEEMGRQFLLSEREIEVMALYALGYTQKRVAEELFITAGTAHAHIKRIYAKTGLHSRQEILDYLQRYAS